MLSECWISFDECLSIRKAMQESNIGHQGWRRPNRQNVVRYVKGALFDDLAVHLRPAISKAIDFVLAGNVEDSFLAGL